MNSSRVANGSLAVTCLYMLVTQLCSLATTYESVIGGHIMSRRRLTILRARSLVFQ